MVIPDGSAERSTTPSLLLTSCDFPEQIVSQTSGS
jgi:hypothetical protein